MTKAELHHHVVEIAAWYGITITWQSRRAKAWALIETLEVYIPPVLGPVSYGVALHELGHCLGRHQSSRSTMTAERWAWRWAREHALIWTPAMARDAARSLAWYAARRWPPRVVHGPPGCMCE